MIPGAARGDRNYCPPEHSLSPLATLLATGFLRLLAQRATSSATAPPPGNPPKPVDSPRAKSVNWVEHEGGLDA